MLRTIPTKSEYERMKTRARFIPVGREFLADTETPVSAFLKLARNSSPSFLLESVEGGEKWGRYSFIGLDAFASWKCKGKKIELRRDGETESFEAEDPIDSLRQFHASFPAYHPPGLPRLAAGMVGYLGYDMVRHIERLPDRARDDFDLPDSVFSVPRTVVAFDNVRHLVTVISLADSAGARAYGRAMEEVERATEALSRPAPAGRPLSKGAKAEVTSNMDREAYEAAVRRAKTYIEEGDAIQVVLSQRFCTRTASSPFDLYRALRLINPSPYMFFLRFDELVLVGSSPELLVRREGKRLFYRPIAGTRRRGATEEEDAALAAEMKADPKERAEHVMLVDLGRNDLGRVAEFGSVVVKDLMRIERYSHVMHLVTDLEAELKEGLDGFDALKSVFPAGTLSGAPKVRAMEIIEELEPTRRGPYGGCVGYVDFAGDLDTCITIRTMLVRGDEVTVQAGAGIVADSVPEREFDETCRKAEGMLRAVELAGELFGGAGQ